MALVLACLFLSCCHVPWSLQQLWLVLDNHNREKKNSKTTKNVKKIEKKKDPLTTLTNNPNFKGPVHDLNVNKRAIPTLKSKTQGGAYNSKTD